ncbi:MAG: HIT domain-containing protein [candidate division Zixibacteria bacterium]|nr:HIT domain-containing protein [candidate division Zixibacteria bacterium]
MREKYLWAPWRAEYILGPKEKGCIFCNALKGRNDKKNLILYRGDKTFVIMNKFPYNSGHVMVVPYRHVGQIYRLIPAEAHEMIETVQLTVEVIKSVLNPESFNIGMNMGKGSGAGVPGHQHMHIVPRWTEDTSYMPVIGKTRVVSFGHELIYGMLMEGFQSVCRERKSRPKRS